LPPDDPDDRPDEDGALVAPDEPADDRPPVPLLGAILSTDPVRGAVTFGATESPRVRFRETTEPVDRERSADASREE
jgi:hypothetical protein